MMIDGRARAVRSRRGGCGVRVCPGRCSRYIEVTRLVSQLPNAWLNAVAPENVAAAARAAACSGE
eukprot:4942539-Prymnesium_polylepis.1